MTDEINNTLVNDTSVANPIVDGNILVGFEDPILGQSVPAYVELYSDHNRDGECKCNDPTYVAENLAEINRSGPRVSSLWGLFVALSEKIKSALNEAVVAAVDTASPIIEGAKKVVTAAVKEPSDRKPVETAQKGLEHYVAPIEVEVRPPEVAAKPPVLEAKVIDSSTVRTDHKIIANARGEVAHSQEIPPEVTKGNDEKRGNPISSQNESERGSNLSSTGIESQDGTDTNLGIAIKSDNDDKVADNHWGNAASSNNRATTDREQPGQATDSEDPRFAAAVSVETPKSERSSPGLNNGLPLKEALEGAPKEIVAGLDVPAVISAAPMAPITISGKQLATVIHQFINNGIAVVNPTSIQAVILPNGIPSGVQLANITSMASFCGAIGIKDSGAPLNGTVGGHSALYASKGDIPEVDPVTKDEGGNNNHGGNGNSGEQDQQEERRNS